MLFPCLAMGSSSKFESIFCEYYLFSFFHLLRFSNREDSNQKLSFFLLLLLLLRFFFFFLQFIKDSSLFQIHSRRTLVPIATRVFRAARSVLVTRSRFTRFATIVIRTSYLSVSVGSSKVASNGKQFSFGRKSRQAITG